MSIDETPSAEEIEASMLSLVAQGYLELNGVDADGRMTYKMTDAGRRYVQQMGGGLK